MASQTPWPKPALAIELIYPDFLIAFKRGVLILCNSI